MWLNFSFKHTLCYMIYEHWRRERASFSRSNKNDNVSPETNFISNSIFHRHCDVSVSLPSSSDEHESKFQCIFHFILFPLCSRALLMSFLTFKFKNNFTRDNILRRNFLHNHVVESVVVNEISVIFLSPSCEILHFHVSQLLSLSLDIFSISSSFASHALRVVSLHLDQRRRWKLSYIHAVVESRFHLAK